MTSAPLSLIQFISLTFFLVDLVVIIHSLSFTFFKCHQVLFLVLSCAAILSIFPLCAIFSTCRGCSCVVYPLRPAEVYSSVESSSKAREQLLRRWLLNTGFKGETVKKQKTCAPHENISDQLTLWQIFPSCLSQRQILASCWCSAPKRRFKDSPKMILKCRSNVGGVKKSVSTPTRSPAAPQKQTKAYGSVPAESAHLRK